MTEAIKCDRCGEYGDKLHPEWQISDFKHGHRSAGYYDSKDLCEKCETSLKKWFEGGGAGF